MANDISHMDIKVQGRSSFDKSFKNILTTKVGTITPIVSKLLIPGSKGRMKIAISATLPPLASDTFMRCSLKTEAFMVPLRLLYAGFEPWLTGGKVMLSGNLESPGAIWMELQNADAAYLAPGSLADYLGVRIAGTNSASNNARVNVYPFLAYWRVIDDWYTNRKIEKPLFFPYAADSGNTDDPYLPCFAPYVAHKANHAYLLRMHLSDNDSPRLGELAQRNYGEDYFTVATSSPQFGNEQKVTIDSNSQFTISALRAANSMQQFEERNNLGSPRLTDWVRVNYGANLTKGIAQRAVLLGSASYDVYSKGVTASADSTPTNNPFGSVGARYGNAFASGNDFVCDFECNEPAYLMVMATLVPEANYASGIKHEMLVFTQGASQVDIPNPLLQNVGNEPIYKREVLDDYGIITPAVWQTGVFGYVPRYTWHKHPANEVHGLLRAGSSLDSFVAQRSFAIDAEISTGFLKIPTTALDNVTAVTADISQYGCWIDSYIDLKVSEPLAESCMPSLQDPAYEHGHTVSVKMNGDNL